MVRLSQLSEMARRSALTHPCQINDDTPWSVPQTPLPEARLALVTTAGLHLRGDRPFVNADNTYRILPTDSQARDLVQSHVSIGFDDTAIQRDLNVVLPLDRMRELVVQRAIGSLGPNVYSFMGAQRPPYAAHEASGAEVGGRLRSEGVDYVFLTGTSWHTSLSVTKKRGG
jgi:D-proline reductase (dithiol) PrdB